MGSYIKNYRQWLNESADFTLISGEAFAHNTSLQQNSPFTLEDQGDLLTVNSTSVITLPDGSPVSLDPGKYDAATIKNMAAKAHMKAGAEYVHPIEPSKYQMQSMDAEDVPFVPEKIPSASTPPGE